MGGMFGVISILGRALPESARQAGGADIRIGLFENLPVPVAQHMVEYEMTGKQAALDAGTRARLADLRYFRDRGRANVFSIGVVTEAIGRAFGRSSG